MANEKKWVTICTLWDNDELMFDTGRDRSIAPDNNGCSR